MKRVKVMVTVFLTLPPGVELVERFVDDGEDLGAHFQTGGELYCPTVRWMRFVPRHARPAEEQARGMGHGYEECEQTIDDLFFSGAMLPSIDHTIETTEE